MATVEQVTGLAREPLRFGKYLLLERISVGGMAEIWRALQVEGARRPVAIKRLLPTVAEHPELVSMFIAEGTLLLQLDHPNIVRVYELGERAGEPFLSMEYVEGTDLRSALRECRQNGEPFPLQRTCELICKLCEALDYAHRFKDRAGREANVVHRDVSPSNLLLGLNGEVKLIDFGIAVASEHRGGEPSGKRAYMSPEQARGLPLDRRSDIFSVGVCLHEMLTGERPDRRPDLSEIPPALQQMLFKALAADPDSRYQYASDLAADLQRFLRQGRFEAKDPATSMHSSLGHEREPDTEVSPPPGAPAPPLPKAVALGPLLSNALAPPRPVPSEPNRADLTEAASSAETSATQRTWPALVKVSDPVRASVRALTEPSSRADALAADTSNPEAAGSRPEVPTQPGNAPSPDGAGPEAATPPGAEPVATIELSAEELAAPGSPLARGRAVAVGFGAAAALLALSALVYWATQEADTGFLSAVIPAELKDRNAKVAFRGEPLALPADGRLVRKSKAGAGLLTVEADGYQPFSQEVQIPGMHKTAEVRPSLVPVVRRAVLAVVADPEDAEVRIDGELIQSTGGAFYVSEVPVGAERVVTVSRTGYKSFESRARASTPGEQLKIRAKLQPIDYSLLVSSTPANALLWANGARIGRTPIEVRLPATTPEVMVSKRCYEPAHIPLSSPTETNGPVPLEVALKKLPGCR